MRSLQPVCPKLPVCLDVPRLPHPSPAWKQPWSAPVRNHSRPSAASEPTTTPAMAPPLRLLEAASEGGSAGGAVMPTCSSHTSPEVLAGTLAATMLQGSGSTGRWEDAHCLLWAQC